MALFKSNNATHFYERGQSIGELLIAIAVAGILVTGATITITTSLRSGIAQQGTRNAVLFGQELLDQASAVALGDWHEVDSASPCIPNEHYVDASGSTLDIVCGREGTLNPALLVNGLQYVRYFSVNDVWRKTNIGGDIVAQTATTCVTSNDCKDPSTKKITVSVTWTPNGPTTPLQFERYITRGRTSVLRDSDWTSASTYFYKDSTIQVGPSITLTP